MTGPDPLVRVEHLRAGYAHSDVLSDVSLDVPRRAVTALVGVNGSGKTTLLRCVLGLLRPRAGTLTFAGGVRPRVGYVPQADASEVTFPVTALEVVLMGRTPRLRPLRRPGATDRAVARACLQRFGVADLAPLMFRSLSGGQRQRVLLARALVADPELLALDEPVRGLDFASSEALVEEIASLARERELAVVVATHSLDLVANHADVVALFKEGAVEVGPAEQMFTDAVLTRYHDAPVVVREVEGRRVVLPGRRAGGPA